MKHDENLVLVKIENNGIAFITLNRPKAMNALNVALINQFEEAFYKLEDDPAVRAIVIRGAGKFFVAGADIKFFIEKIKEKDFSKIISFTRKTSELFLAVENSKKITIAALDGLSLGGGSELALSCQVIVATDKGTMAFPETAIGIFPGLGGMLRLAKKTTPALAKYYTFTGHTISASDALKLGIVTHLVSADAMKETISELVLKEEQKKEVPFLPPEEFKDINTFFEQINHQELIARNIPDEVDTSFAESIIKSIGQKAPVALKLANDIIDMQVGKSNKEAIEIELSHLEEIFSTEDALEGLCSAGKRKPNYTGK